MKNIRTLLALVLAFGLILSLAGAGLAAERMTYEEYQKQLQAYQAREAAAKQAIESEKGTIAGLKAKLDELDREIAALWDQIYAHLNTTKEAVAAFNKELDDIEAKLDELSRLSPEQLLARAADLDLLAARVAAMSADPIAKLTKEGERLKRIAARIESLKASLPKPKHDMYTVLRGDYLWKISKKPDIYGDPWKWLRIWSYNRTAIKNPDLIYPQQQLTIPRQLTKDEVVVVKGDNLKKIAGRPEVYGDPFQWTKIYQANKSGSFLNDPNVIYPEMILSVPRN